MMYKCNVTVDNGDGTAQVEFEAAALGASVDGQIFFEDDQGQVLRSYVSEDWTAFAVEKVKS